MNRNRTIWVVLALTAAAVACCCLVMASALIWRDVAQGNNWLGIGRTEAIAQIEQALVVQEPVRLGVSVPLGDVTVKAETGPRVVVRATKRAWAGNTTEAARILDGIDVRIEQAGNRVQVTATGLTEVAGGRGLTRSPTVDVAITVPRQTAVEIASSVGRVAVTGTQGDVVIEADVGQVTLTDVAPAETLDVRSRVASIEQRGALVPAATYRLASDVGRIAVGLPQDAAFNIEARSDVGNVDVGFELVGRSGRVGFVGREVRGEVGSRPTTHLVLVSRVGDISVRPLP